jgi:hypothetical protein
MTIAIATMGKFIPATQGAPISERVVETGGGTYGYPLWELPKKPQVVIKGPIERNEKEENQIQVRLLNLEVE